MKQIKQPKLELNIEMKLNKAKRGKKTKTKVEEIA
jgi:hypothetical protein